MFLKTKASFPLQLLSFMFLTRCSVSSRLFNKEKIVYLELFFLLRSGCESVKLELSFDYFFCKNEKGMEGGRKLNLLSSFTNYCYFSERAKVSSLTFGRNKVNFNIFLPAVWFTILK